MDSQSMPNRELELADSEVFDEPLWEDQISDEDREYLLGPSVSNPPTIKELVARREWEEARYPGPCPFCGGRNHHSKLCLELWESWQPTLPFGKHAGKWLSEVPKDYLRWLLRNSSSLDSELRTAIEERIQGK